MKKLCITLLFLTSVFSYSQNNITNAFSDSYKHEYKKEYPKAIDAMLKIEDSKKYSINLRLGWLFYLNGEYQKSKVYYENALSLEPKSIEANLGLVYPTSAMQNWDEVIQIYTSILKIDDQNTNAKYRLAYIYFLRKNWTKTEKYLEEILLLFPFDYRSNILLGSTYLKNGKIKEAKRVLNIALAYNPQSKGAIALLKGL